VLGAVGRALAEPRAAVERLGATLSGVREALAASLHFASSTPLNTEIGPHRRFDWTDMDLAAVKEVRRRLGGTINDVVLAVLSGALRRFLRRRGVDVRELAFRAMIPVNVRSTDERTDLGNRVAMVVARLPLDERDPRRRLERVVAETRELKGSRQVLGVRAIEELSDRAFTTLFAQFGRLTSYTQAYNVVVTNVPGPQFPAYMLGARMLGCYPLVPLFRNQALGVALFSYDGRLYWGFNADWDAVPDLHDLVEAVDHEFTTLQASAGMGRQEVCEEGTNGAEAPRPTEPPM
jgi:WS/DGAT/MGAT family acyltransferase